MQVTLHNLLFPGTCRDGLSLKNRHLDRRRDRHRRHYCYHHRHRHRHLHLHGYRRRACHRDRDCYSDHHRHRHRHRHSQGHQHYQNKPFSSAILSWPQTTLSTSQYHLRRCRHTKLVQGYQQVIMSRLQ